MSSGVDLQDAYGNASDLSGSPGVRYSELNCDLEGRSLWVNVEYLLYAYSAQEGTVDNYCSFPTIKTV